MEKLKRFFVALVIFKLTVSVLNCFVGFSLPHVIRQNVTLAVTQRYAIDWAFHQKAYPYLPRSLAGGEHDAILEMEFPLLNYLTVPAFLFNTPTARILARLIYIGLVIGLWFWNFRIWRTLQLLNCSMEIPSLLLILTPISGLYFNRFMPDFPSFILCSIGLGLSLQNPARLYLPFLLSTLGLLEKPTAIIAFGPLLLLANPVREVIRRLKWLLPAVGLPLCYYAFGIKWIRSLSDLDKYYKTEFRDPAQSIKEFFARPRDIAKLWIEQINLAYLPISALGLWVLRRFPKVNLASIKLWSLLLLQTLAIVALDGEHSFIHSYYYVGLSTTAGLLWFHYYQSSSHRFWRVLLCAPILVYVVEHSFYELRDAVIPRANSVHAYWHSCDQLKKRHPEWPWHQGLAFRSVITPVSEISVCFGEIQGSTTSAFGFFKSDEEIPKDCKEIDRDGEILLTKCGS